jgi:hypothetical protein
VQGRWHDFEFYGNDTWKAHQRLTLTMGLRWSRYSPAYSNEDRISNYIPRLYDGVDPLSGLVQANTRGFNRSLVEPYNMGLQPRVGLAWDIFGDGQTALRMGFGRFMSRSNVIEDVLRMSGNPPWTQTVNSNWGGSTANLADDPTFRSLDTINPGLRNAVAGVGANTAFNAVSEDFKPPESWQWNLTVSHELMKNTVLEVSYIGNHGLHLWRRGVLWNDVVPGARAAVAAALRNNQDVTALVSANRRLPGVGPITMSESTGDSSYHGMQVWLNRRFSERLAFQAAYSWGHAISNVPLSSFTSSTTDPFNYDLDRGDADLDRRHMFTGNIIYVLPSYKRWGSLANHILGDWQINAIASFLGGPPVEVTSGANTPGLAAAAPGGFRPNATGAPLYLTNANDATVFLNPAAFSLPAAGQFGTLGRGHVRQPAIENIDLSIAKNWRIRERLGLQFRAEMFNAFNHTNFVGFDTGLAYNNVAEFANDPCNGAGVRPDGGISRCGTATNGGFGRTTATRGPREIQFGLKFSF